MRRKILITIPVLLAFFLVSTVSAQKNNKKSKSNALHSQTHCPVTGEKIKTKYFTDFQGQRIYHSNDSCSQAFLKDPDKYFKIIDDKGIFLENIQEVCPVTGKKMEKNSFIYYKGHRLYLCCKECRKVFTEDREKYLDLLNKQNNKLKTKSAQK